MKLIQRKIHSKAAVAVAFVATAAVVLSVCLFYRSHDPSTAPSPQCLFRVLTGYDCPGCGSQRALHAILNGDIASAWAFNPYLFFAAPASLFFIVAEAGRRRWTRFHAAVVHPVVISIILSATIAWWIGRNL